LENAGNSAPMAEKLGNIQIWKLIHPVCRKPLKTQFPPMRIECIECTEKHENWETSQSKIQEIFSHQIRIGAFSYWNDY
jgi:hypothetical protein